MKRILSESQGVSPVIAVVLLVAITTVLASVVYITVSSLIGQTEVTPYVVLSRVSSNSTATTIKVTGIESTHMIYEYMAILLVNSTVDEQSKMRPIEVGTRGNLTYHDLGDDRLSIGDYFVVSCTPWKRYQISLIFMDTDSEAGSVEWVT